MSKVTVARALTAFVARRFVRLATLIAFGVFGAALLITALLAYFFSSWWWLLIIPFVFLLAIFLVIRLIVVLLVARIHTERLTKQQKAGLEDFTDKIQTLIEARATPWPLVIAICIKDLVLHRDIMTIKKLIRDSAGLKRDYQELERLF